MAFVFLFLRFSQFCGFQPWEILTILFFLNTAEIRIWRKQGPHSKTTSLKKSVSFQIENRSLTRLGFKRNRRSCSGFIFNWEFVASKIENWSSAHLGRLNFYGALFGFLDMAFLGNFQSWKGLNDHSRMSRSRSRSSAGRYSAFFIFSQIFGFQQWKMLTLFSNETTAWLIFS